MNRQKKELHWYEKLPQNESSSVEENDYTSKSMHHKKGIAMEKQTEVNLEKYMINTRQWIDEISVFLKAEKRKDLAWNTLRAILHAIRDRLTYEEVFHLSAQLPILIRGLYFEGYQFSGKPEKFHVDELEKRIEQVLGATNISAEQAFKAVLRVLYHHVSEGQLEDMYKAMPKDIRRLWDESLK